jgi:hypothetical protein
MSKFIIPLFSTVLFFIAIYSFLWINTSSFLKYSDKEIITSIPKTSLTQKQNRVIQCALIEQKPINQYHYVPFLFDTLYPKQFLIIKKTSDVLSNKFLENKKNSMTYHMFRSYSLLRYIQKNITLEQSIEIISSFDNFGKNIQGIENASIFYFNKPYFMLNDTDLISLFLMSKTPITHNFERSSIKEKEIKINKIKALLPD